MSADRLPVFVLVLGALATRLAAQEAPAAPPPSPSRPNIVLLVADDLGWGEPGAQGGKDIPTPGLDALARGGVRFTNGYVSCPVCAPTRAGLLTGRYQQRFGFELNPGPAERASPEFGLPLSEKTLAERLKAAGYATGMFGKWHLGYQPALQPPRRGFDSFFGFLAGAHPYDPARPAPQNPILRGAEPVEEKEFLTDAIAREALAFIDSHRDAPFFLYVPFNAVHAPMQAPPRWLAKASGIQPARRRTFAAMLMSLDEAAGRILDRLRERGLEERTLVFFLSDNGGPTRSTTSRNGPLRGVKGEVFEGGIRVPFFLRWPGRVRAGSVCDHPVIALDVVPTVLAAAGIPPGEADPPLDGRDLLPSLGPPDAPPPHDALCWRFGAQGAIRMGPWKLILRNGVPADLFNLAEDIAESRDRSADEPGRLKALHDAWTSWNSQLLPPKWRRGG